MTQDATVSLFLLKAPPRVRKNDKPLLGWEAKYPLPSPPLPSTPLPSPNQPSTYIPTSSKKRNYNQLRHYLVGAEKNFAAIFTSQTAHLRCDAVEAHQSCHEIFRAFGIKWIMTKTR